MAGAAHGAAVGSSIAGPIGGVIGSITGFVAGVFGAGHAAAEAEKQFRELQKAVTLSMDTLRAAVNHDILGAGISQVNADREQRRKAIEEAYQGGGADSDTVRKRNAALAEMNALEDKRIEQLRKEYAQQQQYDKQDLTVRRLRAEGKLYEADALAFAEAQQREYQDAVNAGRDATYLATLQATQYAEAIAHTANVMQAAVRNAPSGFKVSGYTYDFSSAAPGPSSTSASPSSVTFDLRGTTFEIKGGTGPQMITDFANALRQKANATLGANVPLSTALDRLA